ncbi:uncharacterized protein LOC144315518 [Canis aureus]
MDSPHMLEGGKHSYSKCESSTRSGGYRSTWMGQLMLCPRLRIRETTKEPTQMQTHEGLFTSSSLGPSVPDTAEQGLGPQGHLKMGAGCLGNQACHLKVGTFSLPL